MRFLSVYPDLCPTSNSCFRLIGLMRMPFRSEWMCTDSYLTHPLGYVIYFFFFHFWHLKLTKVIENTCVAVQGL